MLPSKETHGFCVHSTGLVEVWQSVDAINIPIDRSGNLLRGPISSVVQASHDALLRLYNGYVLEI